MKPKPDPASLRGPNQRALNFTLISTTEHHERLATEAAAQKAAADENPVQQEADQNGRKRNRPRTKATVGARSNVCLGSLFSGLMGGGAGPAPKGVQEGPRGPYAVWTEIVSWPCDADVQT